MSVYIGDLLTATAAPVQSEFATTRTWQWLRGSTAISGATSSTYTVQEADRGNTLSVKQIETNIAGTAEATSLTVTAPDFYPTDLFASGEEGAWYEPSPTTCFTDTGGTIAATYGDAVAYLEDQSGNGNHATQISAASRPILARVPETGRRNLLERTEEFDNAYWTKTNNFTTSQVANAANDPNGFLTAEEYTNNATSSNSLRVTYTPTAEPYTFSVWLKAKSAADIGKYVTIGGHASGTVHNRVLAQLPAEWTRFSASGSATAAAWDYGVDGRTDGVFTGLNQTQEEASFYVWGAQLEPGSTATAYQKVVSEYDITEAGVTSLDYLSFDGVDDALIGPNHPFTFTGPVSVFTGAKPESFNTYSTIFSAGTAGWTTANQAKSMAFGMFANNGNKWSTDIWSPSGVFSEPALIAGTNYVSLFNISNWSTHKSVGTEARVNGVDRTVTSYNTANPTSLNAGKTVIGSFDPSALSSGFFDGNLYGLIVRGASSTTGEITNTEAYLANRSGVTLP